MNGHKARTLGEMPGVQDGAQRWPGAARIRELAIIQVVDGPFVRAAAFGPLAPGHQMIAGPLLRASHVRPF
jgi:hypothetical protein